MVDLHCPYCDCGLEVCNDDGFGLDENETWKMQCSECEKNFVFHSTLWWSYHPEKADCLNGDGPHEMQDYAHYPRVYPEWKMCRRCGHQEGKPA